MTTPEEQAAALIVQAFRLLMDAERASDQTRFDGCVPLSRAAAFVPYSVKAMQRKIEEGVWMEGRQYQRRAKPGASRGRIWIDVRAVAEWSRVNG